MTTTTICLSIFVILSLVINVECSDFYVNALNGSNENSGSTPDDAWKTITHALSVVKGTREEPVVIHVASFTHDSELGETFPLKMKSFVTLEGFFRMNPYSINISTHINITLV